MIIIFAIIINNEKKNGKKNETFGKYKIFSTLLTLTNKIIFLQMEIMD